MFIAAICSFWVAIGTLLVSVESSVQSITILQLVNGLNELGKHNLFLFLFLEGIFDENLKYKFFKKTCTRVIKIFAIVAELQLNL